MIALDTAIKHLPSEFEAQLQRFSDYYICSKFTQDAVGPRVALIGENVYYRFLNFLYIPQPPESLTPEQIIEICDLRLDHFDELVNIQLNREVVALIANKSKCDFLNFDVPIKALDFGCGSGLSSQLLLDYLPSLEITGVDISEKAAQMCHQKGLTAIHTFPDKPLPFSEESFDVIFAIFVMHFQIDISTLVELCRILRKSGIYIFNVYMRDVDGIIQQLLEAGFSSIHIWDISNMVENHIIENHKIVLCNKYKPYEIVFH